MARIQELETLASKLIGDGKSPNVFFVTNKSGHVIAVFTGEDAAVDFAENYSDEASYLIEDRKQGEVWTSAEYDRVQQQAEDED